ncbi:hypothetical protein J5N97_009172 [Dioscorea zingiberensis]|uniref:MI domain-containing protein n=1 Tax=Dioscorea zingiberensis TaxID=325984 RepID=A0A9D5CXP8_9LILI|nr:hypothetical protein J5N97_009172 [Dioscorea zingiberensis]
MKYKLKKSREEVVRIASEMVAYARSLGCEDVEFSPEDAGRSDIESFFITLWRKLLKLVPQLSTFQTLLVIPLPSEFGRNDLGLATANTLAGAYAGARQLEVTVNGIGERAGNASLEEVVMAIKCRKELVGGLHTGINSKHIVMASKMVASVFYCVILVIQDGMLKYKGTYEIISPEDIGLSRSNESGIVLGKLRNTPSEMRSIEGIDAIATTRVIFVETTATHLHMSNEGESSPSDFLVVQGMMAAVSSVRMELCIMLLECCSQERTYLRYYGLLGQRFCMINKVHQENFEKCFVQQYSMIHRLETNKLRNVAKFFAHLLGTSALPWHVLAYIRLTEDDTTSSSRIFIKILFQELSEHLGIRLLNERLNEPTMKDSFESIFPKDHPKNTRFAINFFTSIGLGGITESLREHLKNMPRIIMEQQKHVVDSDDESDDESGSDDGSVSSGTGSGSSSESDSSSDKSERNKRHRKRRKR